jgi:hypothetical protein
MGRAGCKYLALYCELGFLQDCREIVRAENLVHSSDQHG